MYRKWNENLFRETYAAYIAGRAATDPSINWYKGEIGFFDFYIIPLAKKLESCGVFGKSSDEFLVRCRTRRKINCVRCFVSRANFIHRSSRSRTMPGAIAKSGKAVVNPLWQS